MDHSNTSTEYYETNQFPSMEEEAGFHDPSLVRTGLFPLRLMQVVSFDPVDSEGCDDDVV